MYYLCSTDYISDVHCRAGRVLYQVATGGNGRVIHFCYCSGIILGYTENSPVLPHKDKKKSPRHKVKDLNNNSIK